jgi:hypothetical protein
MYSNISVKDTSCESAARLLLDLNTEGPLNNVYNIYIINLIY